MARLNTKSPDYHTVILRRDTGVLTKTRNTFIRLFRKIRYAFKNS